MYVLAKNSSLVALDAATGKEIWIHVRLPGLSTRGIAYWESKDRKDRRLIFAMQHASCEQIDARTGKIDSVVRKQRTRSILKEGLGRDPKTISLIQSDDPGTGVREPDHFGLGHRRRLSLAPGDIRAFDVRHRKMAWTFHTIPHPGEFGYETWPKDAWQIGRRDQYVGRADARRSTGHRLYPHRLSPTYDYYGVDRAGTNLFANCLLALDARTRETAVAFPDGASRHVGLRRYHRAATGHGASRRKGDRRGRASDQSKVSCMCSIA